MNSGLKFQNFILIKKIIRIELFYEKIFELKICEFLFQNVQKEVFLGRFCQLLSKINGQICFTCFVCFTGWDT